MQRHGYLLALALLFGPRLALADRGGAATNAPSPAPADRDALRIFDLGLRPLYSFPDALGVNLEVHPFGGNLALEGGVAAQLLETVGFNAAVKYRFPIYRGRTLVFSVGPGIASHWLYDGPRGGYLAQLIGGFAATEAVFWREYFGFRLALDLGVTTAVVDKGYYDRHYGTYPVVNGSVGFAFRVPR